MGPSVYRALYRLQSGHLAWIFGGMMSVDFSGKTVLVAGGTGGLGKAVSLAFVQAGAKTVVTYRKQEEFAALQSAGEAKTCCSP